MNILNADGKIRNLAEIPIKINNELLVTKNSYLLDFSTGDLLQYNTMRKQWESHTNYGIHNHIEMIKHSRNIIRQI